MPTLKTSSYLMESHSSLRQLHQQLGGLTLAGRAMVGVVRTNCAQGSRNNTLNWDLSNPRAQPPLPSLPQWTTSSRQSMEEEGNNDTEDSISVHKAGGWKRPRSYFLSTKQSATNNPDEIENQTYQEIDEIEVPHQQIDNEHELNASQRESLTTPAKLRVDSGSSLDAATMSKLNEEEEITSSGSSSETNQQEETCLSPIRGQFFRPWKKDAHLQDDVGNNSEDWSLPASNKWKNRAIMDPFAKRRARDRYMQSSSRAPVVLPTPTPARTPELPRVHSPLQRSKRMVGSTPTSSVSPRTKPAALAPLNPLRLSSADRIREARFHSATPLSAPCSPRPLPLFSVQGKNRELTHDVLSDNQDIERHDTAKLTAPIHSRQMKEIIQHRKQTTRSALNEIKRKREARRAQHAVEKQRVEKEIREHGDDAGYKFRRLIQQFRDALSPTQQQQHSRQHLPRLVRQDSIQPPPTPALVVDAAETPRLSVYIRKRPLAKKELKAKGYDIISCLFASEKPDPDSENRTLLLRRDLVCHEPKLRVDCSETLENHHFHFDGVFDEWQENTGIYEATVGPMVPYLVSEATACGNTPSLTVFAYGQTGSGKTFTMKSIYRQAAVALFQQIDALKKPTRRRQALVFVGVSFYEIYMNNVNDLLNGRSRMQLMEDGDGAVQLPGLKELRVSNADELLKLVQLGEQARATSANAVHDDSSRSHALLRVTLYGEDNSVALARLSMVDLAGSERASDTQTDKKNTRMEGAEINKSLLALKECIRALDRGASHIPFRQSKLTQLLRDSFLSRDSKTIMIATVSPCSESCNHTLNTLRYADRLKEIGAAN